MVMTSTVARSLHRLPFVRPNGSHHSPTNSVVVRFHPCRAVPWRLAAKAYHSSPQDDDTNNTVDQTTTTTTAIEKEPVVDGCPFESDSAFATSPGEPLPPPLPPPKFTFLRRVLEDSSSSSSTATADAASSSPTVVALDSPQGRHRLLCSMQHETAHSFVPLMNHFTNQSEPTYCGITTLQVVLNALAVDPLRKWRGGWRYFGHEDVLLNNCTCLEPERLRRTGLTLPQFAQLAACQGLRVQLKRPQEEQDILYNDNDNNQDSVQYKNNNKKSGDETRQWTLHDFRQDVLQVLTTTTTTDTTSRDGKANNNNDNDNHDHFDDPVTAATSPQNIESLLVASYARSPLGQTGDGGHFSPVAAYDRTTDSVLILDVARFKYPPYWVTLTALYAAMQHPLDPVTRSSRGWVLLSPPPLSHVYQGSVVQHQAKRLATTIPDLYEASPCPGQAIKVQYCPNNIHNNNNKNNRKEDDTHPNLQSTTHDGDNNTVQP